MSTHANKGLDDVMNGVTEKVVKGYVNEKIVRKGEPRRRDFERWQLQKAMRKISRTEAEWSVTR